MKKSISIIFSRYFKLSVFILFILSTISAGPKKEMRKYIKIEKKGIVHLIILSTDKVRKISDTDTTTSYGGAKKYLTLINKGLKKDTYKLLARYDAISLMLPKDDTLVEYGSHDRKSKLILTKLLRKFENLEFEIKIKKNGEIKSIKGLDNKMEKIKKSLDPQMNKLIEETRLFEEIKTKFGETNLKSTLTSALNYCRKINLKGAGRWRDTCYTELTPTLEFITNYTKLSTDKKLLYIAGVSRVQTLYDSKYTGSYNYYLSGRSENNIVADPISLWPISYVQNTTLDGVIDYKINHTNYTGKIQTISQLEISCN
ncbi:MAG: DUF6263 family protein [Marinifilaceae bacterium]|jgi:hypothetical protein|nr:DUF6263 family protein [Marinifilaceae bacterium]